MNNIETKVKLREAIKHKCEEEGTYYRDVDAIRFLTRCPYCGDSSNPSHAHFYIIADPNSNTNMGYKCFLCEASGVVTQETLSLLGINDPNLKSSIISLNKTADKVNSNSYMEGNQVTYYDFKLPEISRGKKIDYLEKRMGRRFNNDELKQMKVVTSLHTFLEENNVKTYRFNSYVMNLLEYNYLGFLSYGNSHILLRDVTGTQEHSWVKYPILEESRNNRVLYSISQELDPFTDEAITINLSEGIMDIVSVCYNLGYNKKNTLNMCVCGRYYEKVLLLLLDLGFAGSNITINIFADNDYTFNKKAKNPTTIEYFRKAFSNFKYLYKEINIFYNVKSKDCGVPKEEIILKKYRL